jgi:hypothetical protein
MLSLALSAADLSYPASISEINGALGAILLMGASDKLSAPREGLGEMTNWTRAQPLRQRNHRMTRRELMLLLGSAITAPRPLRAQQKAMQTKISAGTPSPKRQGSPKFDHFFCRRLEGGVAAFGRRGLSCHLRGHRATPEDIAALAGRFISHSLTNQFL